MSNLQCIKQKYVCRVNENPRNVEILIMQFLFLYRNNYIATAVQMIGNSIFFWPEFGCFSNVTTDTLEQRRYEQLKVLFYFSSSKQAKKKRCLFSSNRANWLILNCCLLQFISLPYLFFFRSLEGPRWTKFI